MEHASKHWLKNRNWNIAWFKRVKKNCLYAGHQHDDMRKKIVAHFWDWGSLNKVFTPGFG